MFWRREWKVVMTAIKAHNPGFVVIDSLSHLHEGSIEDSTVAKELMKKLRNLCEETKTTIAVIHHTHKLYDRPLSIDTIAGSRMIAQECDFMIGINRTVTGQHHTKDVAFRHADCNSDTVRTFEITEDCWLKVTG